MTDTYTPGEGNEMDEHKLFDIGTRVVVCSPRSWADGKKGTVHHYPDEFDGERVTVELDDEKEPRYLAFPSELQMSPDAS